MTDESSLGFQPSLLTIAPLPRTKVGPYFKRMVPQGQVSYSSVIGEELPHTTIDRRIAALLVTLSKKRNSRRVSVESVEDFLQEYMGQDASGGKTGNIGSVSKAIRRLATLAFYVEQGVSHDGLRAMAGQGATMASGYQITWAGGRFQKAIVQPGLLDSLTYFEWSTEAHRWLVETAVPFDLRVGMSIRGELANDLYHMINRRNYAMHQQGADDHFIPWTGLYAQYSQTGGFLSDKQMERLRLNIKSALKTLNGIQYGITKRGTHEGIVFKRTPLIVDPEAKTTGFL